MKKIRLENTTGNSNKFYEMKETGNGDFIASWSRIGNSVYPAQKSYPMSEWDKTFNAKINKGYHKIPSKGNGSHMKSGKRLVDVLDESLVDITFWNKMFAKMNTLLVAMETAKGNYDIDDPEIRWVTDRIEYWNSEERVLTPQEMSVANHYWKKYK